MDSFFSLSTVLSVARQHPFYNPTVRYPPTPEYISSLQKASKDEQDAEIQLSQQPLLHKENLYQVPFPLNPNIPPFQPKANPHIPPPSYKTIFRLTSDTHPTNTFRHSSYVSITGGGSGKSLPLLFVTSSSENTTQRLTIALLMESIAMVAPTDWVLNLHPSGFLYRALDLSTQMFEAAGASVLNAGHLMPHNKSLQACEKYRINVLTGDAAHVLNFAHFVASLSREHPDRVGLRIEKVVTTSEPLTRAKRRYLGKVLGNGEGDQVGREGGLRFFSLLAAAETGPWAVADIGMEGKGEAAEGEEEGWTDFLFDTRAMRVEVLKLKAGSLPEKAGEMEEPPGKEAWEEEGSKAGALVLTSLQRLKNPLVRYVNGDVGSVHPLPENAFPGLEPGARQLLKILRLHGRDQRFSFKWLSEYYELDKMEQVFKTEEWGILFWQIIVSHGTKWEGNDFLELRLMRQQDEEEPGLRNVVSGQEIQDVKEQGTGIISREKLLLNLRDVFYLTELTDNLFRCVFVDDVSGFVQSETGTKVIKFIDRRSTKAKL
ncbi:MAG: hypothetical protein Q9167_002494 [Letrouitia subvulpina]